MDSWSFIGQFGYDQPIRIRITQFLQRITTDKNEKNVLMSALGLVTLKSGETNSSVPRTVGKCLLDTF